MNGRKQEWWSSTKSEEKAERTELKNYRPLTIVDIEYKVFMLIMRERVQKWAEEGGLMGDLHGGFHKGRKTEDNLFMLNGCKWRRSWKRVENWRKKNQGSRKSKVPRSQRRRRKNRSDQIYGGPSEGYREDYRNAEVRRCKVWQQILCGQRGMERAGSGPPDVWSRCNRMEERGEKQSGANAERLWKVAMEVWGKCAYHVHKGRDRVEHF